LLISADSEQRLLGEFDLESVALRKGRVRESDLRKLKSHFPEAKIRFVVE
jgi:hypothetical protein